MQPNYKVKRTFNGDDMKIPLSRSFIDKLVVSKFVHKLIFLFLVFYKNELLFLKKIN